MQIALVAHDKCKPALVEWVRNRCDALARHRLCATGTTGALLTRETALEIECLKSGPIGGDQQLGARIAEGEIDMLIFFWDPLTAQPHEPDVKALLRLATLYNVPMACNAASADFLFTSPHLNGGYTRAAPDFSRPD